jgi:pyridoxine 5-phosphate synthase
VEYAKGNKGEVRKYAEAARTAAESGLGVNAGHDLNLDNLNFFVSEVPEVLEVSIGHALISEALYFGLENVIGMYLQKLMR